MDDHLSPPRPGGAAALTRRGLIGAGVGALTAATVGGGMSRPARAEPLARQPYPDGLPLLSGDAFPIGVFWPPPPYQTTLERYQEMADAGFNFMITGNYLQDRFIINLAMKWADLTGIKVLEASDPHIIAMMHFLKITDSGAGPLEFSPSEARTWLSQTVSTYQAHPSYAGVTLFDEPSLAELANVAQGFNLYREVAPNRLPYTNLARGISANPTRIRTFIETVDPPLISFDHYPLLTDAIDATFFQDWATVRDAGLEYALPTWTYILSVPHLNFRAPNTAEMLWQVNVSLAYGCKGIQYFTYWTPEAARGEGFATGAGALITLDGRRTERYDGAKSINNGWLSRVGKQLKPLTSETIAVANLLDFPPAGLPAFAPDGPLIQETWGDPVIISRFGRAGAAGTKWYLVVNYSLDTNASARLNFGPGVSRVDEFIAADESYQRVSPSDKHVDVSLEAGAARFYRATVTV